MPNWWFTAGQAAKKLSFSSVASWVMFTAVQAVKKEPASGFEPEARFTAVQAAKKAQKNQTINNQPRQRPQAIQPPSLPGAL